MKLPSILTCLLVFISALSTSATTATDSITIVSRPAEGINANYPGFRPPLLSAPLIKLPVGAVQPHGWLRNYLNHQRDGLCGQLGSISAWLDKNSNQWLSDSGDHGWEEVPYWLRGYASLAYILDDETMKREAQTWFEAIFANLKPDGFLGPRNFENSNPELWAQMIMLWALQTYYEHSSDPRVLSAMTDYFKWQLSVPDSQFLTGYWQSMRGGDNLWSLLWLYNRTGDRSLLPLAEKLHRNTADWTLPDDLPNWHGVNIAQGFREPATYFMVSADSTHLAATYNDFHIITSRYGNLPGGMYAADENARPGYTDPRQCAETCAMVEHMASDQILMAITGDPSWADHCENVALNSFTAALTPDMRALRYLTAPNMAVSDEKLHGPGIDNNLPGMLSLSPFSSRCCQHNHGCGWPYYAEYLVMATTDNGLATMLYSASTTTARVTPQGRNVTLTQTTDYPFQPSITLTLHTDSVPVSVPIYLRIPTWASNASLAINASSPISLSSEATGRYVRIDRTWIDGDSIRLTLPMTLNTHTWPNGSISINYGPLTLSLLIDEIVSTHNSSDPAFVQFDSHWQPTADPQLWPTYTLHPGSPWNYALSLPSDSSLPVGLTAIPAPTLAPDVNPFTPATVPLRFTVTGTPVPSWGYDATGLTDTLPSPSSIPAFAPDTLTLIPMGAARLRISAFPLTPSLQ